MSAAPRVLANTIATVGGRACNQFFRLFAVVAAAAHLGPEGWGTYGLLASSLDLVRALTSLGLDTAAMRWMAIHRDASADVLRRVLRTKAVLSTVAVAGVATLVLFRPGVTPSPALFVIFAFAAFPQSFSASLIARFQVAHAMHWLIPLQALVGGLYLGAVYVAVALDAGVAGFIGLALAYEVVTCAALALVGRRLWRGSPAATAPGSVRALMTEALPLGAMEILVVAYSRLGVFLVEASAGLAEVGLLYVALRINDLTVGVAGALGASALPVFARLAASGDHAQIRRSFARYSLLGGAFSGSVALTLTLFGAPLLALVKPAYADAAPALAAFSWAGVAMFQSNVSGAVLYGFGRFRLVATVAAVNLATFAAVGLWSVPRYGALGAALATLTTEALCSLFYVACVLRLLRREEAAHADLRARTPVIHAEAVTRSA